MSENPIELITTDAELKTVADAIRAKGGTSDPLTYPSGFVNAIQSIPTGGGGGSTDGDVIFIDYDGTIVDAKTKSEINAMTSDSDLPTNPTHTGLTAQGWNWTVAQLKAQLTAMPDQKVYVGQMYVTSDGKTRLYIHIEDSARKTVPLRWNQSVEYGVTIDWGDGSDTETFSGKTSRSATHTYPGAGDYVISLDVTSGVLSLGASSTSYCVLGSVSVSSRSYTNMLQHVSIGSNVTEITIGAFYYCGALFSISIPNTVTRLSGNAFQYCHALKFCTIPMNISYVGTSVFYECYDMKNVSIPYGMTSIPTYAFYYCYSLENITIPSGTTAISSSAFSYCLNITKIKFPANLTTISDSVVYGCRALKNVEIPSNVTSIGSQAFNGCYGITNIAIPNKVTSIGSGAFQNCYSLTSITIPSSVTSIGNSAFSGCYSITNIEIPNLVTNIGNSTFYSCYSLLSITIPNNVTSFGNAVFQYCYNLRSINIPSNVTSIGTSQFYNCYSLASVEIPAGVANITSSMFYNCQSVAEYHFKRETPPALADTNVFYNIRSDCVIYVPYSEDHSILNAYKTASNWATYATYMQEEPT